MKKVSLRLFTILMVLVMFGTSIKPASAYNPELTESQFLRLLFKEFASAELAKMPSDGTYRFAKEYHLAKRLGLPVMGTSYTTFGDEKITRKKAAHIIAQAFTGKLFTEQESVDWMYNEYIYANAIVSYEAFAPEEGLSKVDADQFIARLKQLNFTKLIKNKNGVVGRYRVDSLFKPIATYNTYEQAHKHARKFSYTKVVDTATGMVLWYPETNNKILYHLFVNGKRVAGFDTDANALIYYHKLPSYQARIIDGRNNKVVWDNLHHFLVKNNSGQTQSFKTLNEAYSHAFSTDHQQSYILPIDNDVNQYKNSFLTREAANINNGVLIYNGFEIDRKAHDRYELGRGGIFPTNFFKPYIAYEKNGKFVDRFFDTFIILGRFYSQTGRFEEIAENQANYQEWQWYKERTFQPGGAIDSLNSDVSSIQQIDKVKAYIAIPYPKREGSIIKLDETSVTAGYGNRLELVTWYIDQVLAEFNSNKFENIQFEGFYWLNETVVSKEDENLIKEVANYIHINQKRFIFSPYSRASNFKKWSNYGFDAAYFQSNARLITDPAEVSKRLHWGYMTAFQHGMGINLEIEDTLISKVDSLYKSFDQYMDYGSRYGLKGNSTIMYQGTVMIHRLANDKSRLRAQNRAYYDKIYEFLNK